MRVLVTGSEGFLGKKICKFLEKKKYKVLRFSKSLGDDVRDFNQCLEASKKVDGIIHCAAILNEKSNELFDVNVLGTQNIVNAALQNRVKKFVFISTAGVYGETTKPACETCKPNPQTSYEKSKWIAELIVKKNIKKACILRPALIIGANKYWKSIIKLISKGFPLIGNGRNLFHLAYVEDVANAAVFCVENKKASGETFNVACKEPLTLEQTVIEIKKELGLKPSTIKIPKNLGMLLAYIYSFFKEDTLLLPEHVERLTRNRIYSIEKIISYGFEPKYSMREAIKATINELRKKGAF